VVYVKIYHGLHSSASPVLTAIGLDQKMANFEPPNRIHALQMIIQKCDYVSDLCRYNKFGANPPMGASGQIGKI